MQKTVAQLRTEIREEILREQAIEAEKQRLNRQTFKKVLSEFEGEFKKFDWTHTWSYDIPRLGMSGTETRDYYEAHKVKAAIGTLAKAAFRATSARNIPSGKEKQLRKITQEILSIVMNEMDSTA